MKHSLKRLTSLLLVLSMCVTLLLGSADAAESSCPGEDGDSVSWSLNLKADRTDSDEEQTDGGSESSGKTDADCSEEYEIADASSSSETGDAEPKASPDPAENTDSIPDGSASSPVPELENPTQAQALRLTAEKLELYVGERAELSGTVEPEGEWVIHWKSSDEAVASVDEQGAVTAHQPGNCTITAAAGGAEASCSVTVKASSLALDQTKYTLDQKERVQLNAAVEGPDNAVSWTSSDSGVASVNSSGLVSGIGEGKCTITASANGLEARCKVRVRSDKGTVLMLASDYQPMPKWQKPQKTLTVLLKTLNSAGLRPENAILCGDYSAVLGHNDHNQDPAKWIAQIKETFRAFDKNWDHDATIFVQGNHDKKTKDISAPGLHEYDDYLVYVLNAQSEYPSAQGRYKREKRSSAEQNAWKSA